MTSTNKGIDVSIHEHTIKSVSTQKHLGITIDKNLTWGKQIDLICKSTSRNISLMDSKYVDQDSLKQYEPRSEKTGVSDQV